jgi:hypothetical protein
MQPDGRRAGIVVDAFLAGLTGAAAAALILAAGEMDMVFGRKIRLERGDVDSLHVAFTAWMERAERALGATRDFRTRSAADRYLRDLRAAEETLWSIHGTPNATGRARFGPER